MINPDTDSFSPYISVWKMYFLLLVVGAVGFLGLSWLLGYEESFIFLHHSWGTWWDELMPHLTHLADGAMVGGLFGVIYARQKPELVAALLISLIMVAIAIAIFKQGVFSDWHRPAHVLGTDAVRLLSLGKETRLSFPSGHSAAAGCLGWYIATAFPRPAWGILVALVAMLLGFTRIYIGVHFPADVGAGLLLGGLIALGGTWVIRRLPTMSTASPSTQRIITIALTLVSLAFLVLGGINTLTKYYLL